MCVCVCVCTCVLLENNLNLFSYSVCKYFCNIQLSQITELFEPWPTLLMLHKSDVTRTLKPLYYTHSLEGGDIAQLRRNLGDAVVLQVQAGQHRKLQQTLHRHRRNLQGTKERYQVTALCSQLRKLHFIIEAVYTNPWRMNLVVTGDDVLQLG